jgi:hypothetical protein
MRPEMQFAVFNCFAQRCDAPRRGGEQSEDTLDFSLCSLQRKPGYGISFLVIATTSLPPREVEATVMPTKR